MDRIRGFEVVTKYTKAGINVNLPKRNTENSAGYDFQSITTMTIPSIWKQIFDFLEIAESNLNGYDEVMDFVNKELENIELKDFMKKYGLRPILVPTGIKSYMLDDEFLQLSNRSSGALNKGLILTNGVGVIDADYYNNPDNEGEIFFQFINFLPFDVTINQYENIGQGIFKKFLLADDDNPSGKRIGGMGSTDEKGR